MRLIHSLLLATLVVGCSAPPPVSTGNPTPPPAQPSASPIAVTSPSAPGKDFTAPDGSFSCRFPDEAQGGEAPDKRSYQAMYASSPGRVFTVGYRLSEKKLDAKAAATALDAIATQFTQGKSKATRKRVEQDGIPGIEIASPQNEGFDLTRYIVVSDRVYFVSVTGETEKELAADSQKFFASLRLLKK